MLEVRDYQVLTRTGFNSFKGIREVVRSGRIEIMLDDGTQLICSTNHRVMTSEGWKVASEIYDSDLILKDVGLVKVFDVQYIEGEYTFYDLIDVEGGNEYYTNNVVSHNCEFLGSSNTLIDPTVLARLTYSTPIRSSHDISIYTEPAAGRLYTIVADTSRALSQDYSAFTVVDVTEQPYQLVAKYRNNKISSLLYPEMIYKFAKHYNDALVLVESNDIGKQVADILYYDLEYENTIFSMSDKGSTYITSGFGGQSMQIGLRTTKSVKKIGCSVLKTLIESDRFIINDFDVLQELFRFSAKGESFEAEEGNDDLVMTLVLFAWMINQSYIKDLINNDVRKSYVLMNEQRIEEELTPFGMIDNGQDDMPADTHLAVSDDSWLLVDNAPDLPPKYVH